MSMIEVRNLIYSYNNETNAVDDISFDIKEGTYTTIIGHNGSGKSTLAKLMAGLLEPKAGEIKIDGMVLNEENLPLIRNELGIVFQNPDNQFIGSTVKDDIAFGLENRQVPSEEMEKIIEEYIEKVNLTKFMNSEPQNLSGGQKQRVAIAGVMAMQPKIIIFDEATSMLDPKGKKEIKKLMYDLAESDQFTIISITHDIEEVMQSDDCIVMNKGRLFMHNTPLKVFEKAEQLKKIDLDVPFVFKVKEAFNKKHIRLKSDDLKGLVDELCQYRSNR
ncbi:MAG: energy-coupling factor transporter ATPase [Erysipelotrichaceae bacterium]|nr:energy-coupling factor transporter ATPase [Erysipelotrichaceae bacterium]